MSATDTGETDAWNATQLHTTLHKPAGAASSVIVLCHGVHQHGGLYEAFTNRLKAEGFAVVAYDLRGFGMSAGVRGMVSANSFGQAVDDLRFVINMARKEVSAGKLFVFGHSLGGLIACLLATSVDATIADGYVLSSPSVAVAPPLRSAVAGAALECLPGRTVLAKYELDSGSSNAAFKERWSTAPPTLCDPSRPFRVAYVRQARRAQLLVRKRFASFSPSAAVLILSGGLDLHQHDHGACADLHRALQASATRTADTTLKTYADKKHELVFEEEGKDMNDVVDDIVVWLKHCEKI